MRCYKTVLLSIFLFLSLGLQAEESCFDFPVEKQNKLVYDYVGFFNSSENNRLEQKLRNYNDTTSTQIAVVIVDHVHCDIGYAAVELGDDWGIGEGAQDNGVLFLVASEDRKIFIATGEGAEATVPDILAGRIVDNVIKPNFRNGYYYTGIDKATDMVMDLMSGEFEAAQEAEPQGIPIWVIILLIFVIFLIISRSNRGGGGGKQYDYNRNGRWVFEDDWGQNSGTWGDFRRGRGVFIPPRGGGFGGGGFGGGGGGFGGFGGGSFGGGGAGGSW